MENELLPSVIFTTHTCQPPRECITLLSNSFTHGDTGVLNLFVYTKEYQTKGHIVEIPWGICNGDSDCEKTILTPSCKITIKTPK